MKSIVVYISVVVVCTVGFTMAKMHASISQRILTHCPSSQSWVLRFSMLCGMFCVGCVAFSYFYFQ